MESPSSIMIIRSSCFLNFIILFLCFSLHACNARPIRLRNPGFPKEFLSCKIGTTSDSFQPAGADDSCWEPKKMKGLREEIEHVSRRSSNDVVPFRFISLERSIPWHAPRKKHEKNPGFYSDYSRPQIRPPSHN